MQNAMLDKLNKVYFLKLRDCLDNKLGEYYPSHLSFSEVDVKADISSNISV